MPYRRVYVVVLPLCGSIILGSARTDAQLSSVHAFTAAVIQASVLLRAPTSMLAADVRHDFDLAYAIFCEVAPGSVVARRALPILTRLRQAVSPEQPQSLDL